MLPSQCTKLSSENADTRVLQYLTVLVIGGIDERKDHDVMLIIFLHAYMFHIQ